MEFKVEEYNDVYKQQIIDLIVNIQRKEFNIPITPEEQPDLQNIPGFYQKGKGNFWVAVTGNTVVGTIAILDINNNQGALRKMFVSKNFRGREHGVGQALLDKLLEWTKQKGISEIYLGTTEKFIAAHRFYEKNNFKQVDITSLPATFPRMAVDVIFYKFNAQENNMEKINKEEIIEVVNKLFVYTDNRAWNKLQSEVFTDQVFFDMSSLGGQKALLTSKNICDLWNDGFKGIDYVNHLSGNYIVNVNDATAIVSAYATATHYKSAALNGKTREFVGTYDIELVFLENSWRINKFKYNLKFVVGNIELT